MRTMIGKRIGPVPIALVAVLALAAFISAGLWLTPTNGAQAQGTKINDIVLEDLGVGLAAPTDDDAVDMRQNIIGAFGLAATETATFAATFTGTGETGDLGALAATDITVSDVTATDRMPRISIPAGDVDTTGVREVTITATISPARDPVVNPTAKFMLTVLQDPTKEAGVEVENPILATDSPTETSVWPVKDDSATDDVNEAACEVVADTTATLSSRGMRLRTDTGDTAGPTEDDGTTDELLVSGGDCTTTGDSVNVIFKNTIGITADGSVNGEEIVPHLIYQTSGSKFTGVKPVLAKAGLTEHKLTVPVAKAAEGIFGDATPGMNTITVERGSAEEGIVYLVGYSNVAAGDLTQTDGTAGAQQLLAADTTFRAEAEFVVKIVFLDPPHAGMSSVSVPEFAEDATTVDVMVKVHDENGTPLEGVNVDVSLMPGVEGGSLPSGVLFENGRTMVLGETDANGVVPGTMVKGLTADEPVRLMVQAKIYVDGGDDIYKSSYIVRDGKAATVHLSTYAEMPIVEPTGGHFFVRAVAYDSAMNDVSDDEATNLMVVGSDEDSNAAIMTPVMKVSDVEEWWDTLNCMQMNDAVMPMNGQPAVGPDDMTSPYCAMYDDLDEDAMPVVRRAAEDWYKVMIEGEAAAGMYSVKATAGPDDDMIESADMIGFTVAGAAESYSIYTTDADGMATDTMAAGTAAASPIRLNDVDDAETYVLMVRDANGNAPSSPMCVTLGMSQGTDAALSSDAKMCDSGSGYSLRPDGNVTFTVTYDFGIEAGTVGRLSVRDGTEAKAYRYFQFGRTATSPTGPTNSAPRAVGSIADFSMTLGDAPMTVTAGFADPDGDTLGYSVMSDNTDAATATSNGGGSVTVTAVGEGTATITVTASDGQAEASQMFMVTVMAPVDMTLGSPMNLMATPGDGQIMLSWTAGANADKHVVYGIAASVWASGNNSPTVAWSFTDAADSHTVMDLENGTDYQFLVIAGQDNEDGTTTWSSWSNWAMGTPVADTFGGLPPPPGS